ncbi:Trans-aconitate methyltransferase [Piscirickettsia salmonis]|uniref:Trans-aconitate methyltransferase n=1 Tax=Piscirickettsia salmonis TaxID=1238 RepID=A0A9Q6LKJ7_PISSA|nr:class I SAM-dependent methyltransferase [Piscirickettsia salmonis]QGN95689.1 Trans-aconitate methyltransferase [Piscirickettsia salmonis]QGO05360.1 Trans-aconitate methyltransferase [Piscirickettsia salmonis]QGO33681.1 Trans-aconitate methyltransferase [Piscirickettsia salmonis]QGO37293.1 Trans-aconitate methyltransferase [Piscirickettsia salmonis]QGO40917.1 Trans-aconitate methyltransferase [Piscirickettsia salmonis]
MESYQQGYCTALPYVQHYHRELSPSFLNFICTLNNVQAPALETQAFRYCDLGCGYANSLLFSAASFPKAKFYGIDFMAEHIESAEALRTQAGIDNLKLIHDDFVDCKKFNFEKFDYIVMHGLYSWVSEAVLKKIHAFIRRFLKPTGLVYIGYNAAPGWDSLRSIRELLLQADGESYQEKIKKSQRLLQKLQNNQAQIFSDHPLLAYQLDSLTEENLHYLVHEYYHQDWQCFYATQMIERMKALKLAYAGSATLINNFDQFQFSKSQVSLIQQQKTPALQELMRDYLLNTRFRCDIYLKKVQKLSDRQKLENLMASRFSLLVTPDQIKKQISVFKGIIQIPELVNKVTEKLVVRAKTLSELRGEINEPVQNILQVLLLLLMSYQVALTPVRPSKTLKKLNRLLCEQALESGLSHLGLAGASIPISAEEQWLLSQNGSLDEAILADQLIKNKKSDKMAVKERIRLFNQNKRNFLLDLELL